MAPDNRSTQGEGEGKRGERRKGMISGPGFQDKVITFSAIGDRAVLEGDIIVGTVAELEGNLARGSVPQDVTQGVARTGYRWPDGVVPFDLAPDFPRPERVLDAMKHLEAKTRIRFVRLLAGNANAYRDWVEFVDGDECFSYVGMKGGRQEVVLGPMCGVGSAIHEIGHTLGLWHEQSREDRDQYVDILWDNIKPENVDDFKQQLRYFDDVGNYNYGSIMHYRRRAFSKNQKDTIRPKKSGVRIGQRTGLNPGDISAIKSMYPRAGR
jgi:hypothetical protein